MIEINRVENETVTAVMGGKCCELDIHVVLPPLNSAIFVTDLSSSKIRLSCQLKKIVACVISETLHCCSSMLFVCLFFSNEATDDGCVSNINNVAINHIATSIQ